jgi:proteic killer suppression protein
MIVNFANAVTEDLYNGVSNARTRGLPTDVMARAVRMLDRIAAATEVNDLRLPPSNRLHKLQGDRADVWSVSVNDQWRITFKWSAAGPAEVCFEDYH